MIELECRVELAHVREAASIAQALLRNEEFLREIARQASFDQTSLTPAEVAERMQSSDAKLVVVAERIGRRRTRAVAAEDARRPGFVVLSERKLDRTVPSIVNSIVHEAVHCVDRAADDAEFGHDSNNARGKSNTAPYFIGDLAEAFAAASLG